MNERELAVRRAIFESFAATGEPPRIDDVATLEALARRHVIVIDQEDPGRIVMAHPFAAFGGGASVTAGERTWWGNCAWDALGIVAALELRDATVENAGTRVEVRGGSVVDQDLLFHVAVPAAHWWEDVEFT
jgi:Alkylmercury lyase